MAHLGLVLVGERCSIRALHLAVMRSIRWTDGVIVLLVLAFTEVKIIINFQTVVAGYAQ